MISNTNFLGNRLRNLREDSDLTQKDLAIKIGLTPKMISFYENNQRTPPADILLKLADIFDTSTDYLLGHLIAQDLTQTLIECHHKTVLGHILRSLREQKILKQSDIAKKLNISLSAYSLYEQDKGEPSLAMLIKIAKIFDVSTDYLLGLSDTASSKEKNSELALNLDKADLEVLEYYKKLNRTDQLWILGQMIDLDKEATKDSKRDYDGLEPKQA